MTVVIHEPHGASYGGVVAAPVFRNIAAKALPYLAFFPARANLLCRRESARPEDPRTRPQQRRILPRKEA